MTTYRCECGWEGQTSDMKADCTTGSGEEDWSNHICPNCGMWQELKDYKIVEPRHLFNLGDFKSHSGATLPWKVDCDALEVRDWRCIAAVLAKQVMPFGSVEGVPRGGLLLAMAMKQYVTQGGLLIVDDVLTTGGSMEAHRAGRKAQGAVFLARSSCPSWVDALLYTKGAEW